MIDVEQYLNIKLTPMQKAFVYSESLSTLTGNLVGGTTALVAAAVKNVDSPHHRGFLFCHHDSAVHRYSLDDCKYMFAPILSGAADRLDLVFEERWREIIFPSGARLIFDTLGSEHDVYRYGGVEATFVGFDHIERFPGMQYRYMLSRLRTPRDSGVKIQFMGCGRFPDCDPAVKYFGGYDLNYIDAAGEINPHVLPEYYYPAHS